MLVIGVFLANLASIVAAGIYGAMAFCFGVYFYVNVAYYTPQHLVWTIVTGVLFVVTACLTFKHLFLVQRQINRIIDTAAREEQAAQNHYRALTTEARKKYPFHANQLR